MRLRENHAGKALINTALQRGVDRPRLAPAVSTAFCPTRTPPVLSTLRTQNANGVPYISPGLPVAAPSEGGLPWVTRHQFPRTLKGCHNPWVHPFRPGGARDNNPTFQRWVLAPVMDPSPAGTAETRRHQ